MTTITAQVIADSIAYGVPRLTTMQLRFPRILLPEFNTHRVISKNARSSRAVPIGKLIEEVETAPFIPLHWGAAQKGMRADNECANQVVYDYGFGEQLERSREDAWLHARDAAVETARAFMKAGYAKQLVNRILEPFMHVDVLATSVEWQNFFLLRDHPDAEPHIQILARVMRKALADSEPRELKGAEWHMPFITRADLDAHGFDVCRKLSVSRSARISYAPFDGNASIDAELARYAGLVGSEPRHSSPAEHQASPDLKRHDRRWERQDLHRNLSGWKQHRAMIETGLLP